MRARHPGRPRPRTRRPGRRPSASTRGAAACRPADAAAPGTPRSGRLKAARVLHVRQRHLQASLHDAEKRRGGAHRREAIDRLQQSGGAEEGGRLVEDHRPEALRQVDGGRRDHLERLRRQDDAVRREDAERVGGGGERDEVLPACEMAAREALLPARRRPYRRVVPRDRDQAIARAHLLQQGVAVRRLHRAAPRPGSRRGAAPADRRGRPPRTRRRARSRRALDRRSSAGTTRPT